jgi:hypothetical protein
MPSLRLHHSICITAFFNLHENQLDSLVLAGRHNAAIDPRAINIEDKSRAIASRVESLVRPPHGCGMPLGRLFLTVACRNSQACLTLELNGAQWTPIPRKPSMRGELIARPFQ